jgi:hypothetical protein
MSFKNSFCYSDPEFGCPITKFSLVPEYYKNYDKIDILSVIYNDTLLFNIFNSDNDELICCILNKINEINSIKYDSITSKNYFFCFYFIIFFILIYCCCFKMSKCCFVFCYYYVVIYLVLILM